MERNNIVINGAGYSIEGNGTENGITLLSRSKITIKNVVVRNFTCGIYLNSSLSNTLSGNTLTKNDDGIGLDYISDNNILSENIVRNNTHGIWLSLSSNNVLRANEVTNNDYGVDLWFSSNNTLSRNNITTSNYQGIRIWNSSDNTIFHNSFVNNTSQVYTISSNNKWDEDYPVGGNYWSDYTGVDFKKGPNQDQPGSDGIGDTPYTIAVNNQDRYPLMKPLFGIHDITVRDVTLSKTVVGQGYNANVNVTISNIGDYTETFNMTVYANYAPIQTKTITITHGNSTLIYPSTTITFTWNTAGFAKGNYTIWAYAWPVLGETDTVSNTLVDGWVIVSMVGDITGPNGWPDGKCDMRDVAIVAKLFGINHPDPRYNPNCDLTGPTTGVPDGKIDMKDIATVAKNFGKTD